MPEATSQRVQVQGRTLRLTSLEKVLYPVTGTTKAEVIDYLAAVSEPLLRQLHDRPVTRIRWPHGTGDSSFFEKNAPAGTPDWIRTAEITGTARGQGPQVVRYPLLADLPGLVWAANLSALELHTPQWQVAADDGVRHPDRLVIDLDPGPGTGLAECAHLAVLVAGRLAEDGFEPVPVTSGSKGLQLYAAVAGDQPGEAVREYVRQLGKSLARDHRDLMVTTMTKAQRVGKVLLDWSQNSPAKTTITPYSPRGRDQPWAAAPRRWDELDDHLAQLTMVEVAQRVQSDGDLMPDPAVRGPRVPG